jgi:putative tryptophan/tyrosine transport system substrate-binding protein
VGVVYQGGPYEVSIEGLREGLKAAGLEEGRDIALLLRNVRGDAAASEAAARSLERDEKVHVIVAIGTTTALAAQRGTKEVPIVFAAGSDPITAGLVASIAKPGGRLTGFHLMTNDLTAKRLEILREIVPKLRRVIAFYNPRNRLRHPSRQPRLPLESSASRSRLSRSLILRRCMSVCGRSVQAMQTLSSSSVIYSSSSTRH